MAHLLKEGVSLGTDDGLLLKKGVSLGTDDGYWSTMHLYAIMFQEILFFFLEAKCITMSCESKMKLKFEISTRYQMQIDTEPNNIIHTAHTREPQ